MAIEGLHKVAWWAAKVSFAQADVRPGCFQGRAMVFELLGVPAPFNIVRVARTRDNNPGEVAPVIVLIRLARSIMDKPDSCGPVDRLSVRAEGNAVIAEDAGPRQL